MKSNSNQQPPRIQDLGDGRSHFNYHIVEEVKEDELQGSYTFFSYDQVTVINPVNYPKIVEALVSSKYSIADEISIQRQKETKPEEFQEYFDFVENCKKIANE